MGSWYLISDDEEMKMIETGIIVKKDVARKLVGELWDLKSHTTYSWSKTSIEVYLKKVYDSKYRVYLVTTAHTYCQTWGGCTSWMRSTRLKDLEYKTLKEAKEDLVKRFNWAKLSRIFEIELESEEYWENVPEG